MQSYVPRKNKNFEYSIQTNDQNERHSLVETNHEKDLGIHITNDLKWKTQAQHAANRANAVSGSLKRTFSIWTAETTKILYKTFVRPHL